MAYDCDETGQQNYRTPKMKIEINCQHQSYHHRMKNSCHFRKMNKFNSSNFECRRKIAPNSSQTSTSFPESILNRILQLTNIENGRYKNLNSAAVLLLTLNLLISLSPCDAFLLDGSQNSFSQFRKWYTGLNGSLEFEFKTEQPNGLLLYTDDGGTFDFFEIKLVEGVARLRYNLGGGANIITVGRELHDGHWHKVQVSKKVYLFLK